MIVELLTPAQRERLARKIERDFRAAQPERTALDVATTLMSEQLARHRGKDLHREGATCG